MIIERGQLGGAAACRFCGELLSDAVVDLGMSPLCESYLRPDQLNAMEAFYPLHVYVCRRCWLVQLEQYVSAEHIFSEYAYFSSFADSWVQHARDYTNTMIDRFGFGPHSQVIEFGEQRWLPPAVVREEDNAALVSRNPKGEPQLGRRGLYRSFGGRAGQALLKSALLWVMSLADGEHTTLDVAEQAELPFVVVAEAVSALERVDLLRPEAPRLSTRGDER